MRTLKTSGQFASFVHCRMLLFQGIFGLACIYLKVDNIVRGSYPYGKLNSFLLDIFIHFAPKLWCSERLIISSRPTFIEPIKFTRTWKINQEHLCYLRIGFYSCQTCDTWDGLSCHLVNAEKQNVDSRQIFIWSLIHGLNWFVRKLPRATTNVQKNKSYVGLFISYVGLFISYVGLIKSYVGLYNSYVGDKIS